MFLGQINTLEGIMRIMGFSIDWPKLKKDRFTTFRFERRDRDWSVGEIVQVKVQPRSKGGGLYKGNALIEAKESKDIIQHKDCISEAEAKDDGFENKSEMWKWFLKAHPPEQLVRPLYKLTLKWIK